MERCGRFLYMVFYIKSSIDLYMIFYMYCILPEENMILIISAVIMILLYKLGNKLFKEYYYNGRLKIIYLILCFIIIYILIRLSYLYF